MSFTDNNVCELLPLLQEYQIDVILKRAEEFLLTQVSSVKNFLIAQKFNLKELYESNFNYLKRAPITRLKSQPDFAELDKDMVIELLMEKCCKFEDNLDSLREVRMVLERKKPTTFPGMHLLCDQCTGARQQQVDCDGCMKNCCKKITEILRNLEKWSESMCRNESLVVVCFFLFIFVFWSVFSSYALLPAFAAYIFKNSPFVKDLVFAAFSECWCLHLCFKCILSELMCIRIINLSIVHAVIPVFIDCFCQALEGYLLLLFTYWSHAYPACSCMVFYWTSFLFLL